MTPHDLDPRRGDLAARLHRLGSADDATDGPLADVTAGLTARVRRRRRQRTLGSGAAVAVVAAALVLVPGSPAALLDRAAPQPATTAGVGVDGLCGLALTPGYDAPGSAPVALSVTGERATVTADETWSADITHAPRQDVAADPSRVGQPTWDDTELALVATEGADAGRVVGVGNVPLSRGGTLRAADGADGTRTHNATGFVGCDGEQVPAGQYRAIVADLADPARAAATGLTGLKGVERTSQALPLTVREPKSTPEGTTRPAWLDGTSLWCGMSETDLFRAMPDPVDAPVAASPSPVTDVDDPSDLARPGIRIENLGPKDVTVTVGDHPVVAWIDQSTKNVVSFGPDELATPRTLTVRSGKTLDYRTTGYDPTDHCGVADDGSTLPPGLYDLVVYTRMPEGAADGSAAFLYASGPQVRVLHGGSVTTDLGEVGDASAALALTDDGHQPPWIKGTGSGLHCGMTESSYEGQSWPDAPLTISGFIRPKDSRAGAGLDLTHGSSARVTTSRDVGVAWFTSTPDDEPGKLVSFGADPGPDRARTVTKQGLLLDGALDAPDSCAPDAHGAYTQHLPAGDYWIALYVRLTTADGGQVWLTDSGAMGVTVDADGVVARH